MAGALKLAPRRKVSAAFALARPLTDKTKDHAKHDLATLNGALREFPRFEGVIGDAISARVEDKNGKYFVHFVFAKPSAQDAAAPSAEGAETMHVDRHDVPADVEEIVVTVTPAKKLVPALKRSGNGESMAMHHAANRLLVEWRSDGPLASGPARTYGGVTGASRSRRIAGQNAVATMVAASAPAGVMGAGGKDGGDDDGDDEFAGLDDGAEASETRVCSRSFDQLKGPPPLTPPAATFNKRLKLSLTIDTASVGFETGADLDVAEIIPGKLFFSGRHGISRIADLGITAIVSIGGGAELDAHSREIIANMLPGGMEKVLRIVTPDSHRAHIDVDGTVGFMAEEMLETNGAVLVHCQMGKSRSAAVIVTYLATRKDPREDFRSELGLDPALVARAGPQELSCLKKCTVASALVVVKKAHPIAEPNAAILSQAAMEERRWFGDRKPSIDLSSYMQNPEQFVAGLLQHPCNELCSDWPYPQLSFDALIPTAPGSAAFGDLRDATAGAGAGVGSWCQRR